MCWTRTNPRPSPGGTYEMKVPLTLRLRAHGAPPATFTSIILKEMLDRIDGLDFEVLADPANDPNGYQTLFIHTG